MQPLVHGPSQQLVEAVDGPTNPAAVVTRRRRRPAFDGLRALAVGAVVVYHLDASILPGGFVGVDLFFVLSGFLITALLLNERERTGAVSLRAFWGRRVRRLWPFAWLVLAAVAVAGLWNLWGADRQRTLPSQTVASLLNVANWWQLRNGGYTEQYLAPSPLRHFWSLAVEEQFYLFWPLLLVGLLLLVRRWGGWTLWAGIGLLSVGSILAAWFSTPERAYLGTDSRAIALLVGSAVAVAWQSHPMVGPTGRAAGRAIALWGAAGATVLLWACFVADPEAEWLHHGGFTLIAVASAGVIAAAATNHPVRRALSVAPLVWLGERSYGIYLVHWPIIVALGPDGPLWRRAVIVVGSSIVIAGLVHRWLERPVLIGAVRPRYVALGGLSMLALMAFALVWAVPSGVTPEEEVQSTLDKVEDPTTSQSDPGSSSGADGGAEVAPTTTICVPVTTPPAVFGDDQALDRSTMADVADPNASACGGQVRVLVLGDSTGRGVSNGLTALADPRVQIWDRTQLGCSFGPEKCGDWREGFGINVMGIKPDVVLIYTTVVIDLAGVDDAPFLSPEADEQRVAVLTEAARIAGSTGAKVLLTAPPRPDGAYYCNAANRQTSCDQSWTDAFSASVRTAASATGAGVVEAGEWADTSGEGAGRPDGLHFSGTSLRRLAEWLTPQLLTAAGRDPAVGGPTAATPAAPGS